MKKKLFGLMLLVLVMMMAVGAAQADAPNTVEKYCSVCKKDRTFIRTGFACITGSEHNSIYNCTTCADEAIWTEYREAHLVIPATCLEKQRCVYCNLEDYAWQYNGNPLGHKWGEWTFNGGGTHTRTCTNDASHTETGNCKSYTWEYDANSHKKTWTCSVCPGGADTRIEQDHVYTGDTDHLTCDLCGYVRTVEGELSITGSMPAATVGVAYSVTFGYTGTASGVVFWNATGLPEGLSINHGSGTVSGTPTTAGTYKVTISMGATGGGSAAENFTLTVTEPAHTHDWGNWVSNDDGTHTRTCADDATHTETNDCSGGTATCTEQAVCEVCGEEYGEIDDANCSGLSEWEMVDDSEHYAYCSDCKTHVFENHTSDDSSCTPTCTVCKQQYLDPDGEHGSMTDWAYKDETRHIRVCTGCGAPEYADHSGGTATCTAQAVCTGCNEAYGDPLGQNWGEWASNDDGTHTRTCKTDASHTETGNCSGGTATCTEPAKCEVCGGAYGEVDPNAHDWGNWASNDDGTHARTCKTDASHTETGNCSGGTATCTDKAVCEVCGSAYGEVTPNAHDWGEWHSATPLKQDGHFRDCRRNNSHREEKEHTGGNPTCTEADTCTVCGGEYFDRFNHANYGTTDWMPMSNGTHHYKLCLGCGNNAAVGEHSFGAATCTEPAKCVCGVTSGDPLGHTPGAAATCTTDQVCTRTGCGAVLAEKLGHIPGAEADCTNDQVCTRDGCGAVLAEKLGHEYAAVVTKPTCTKQGYTTYTCSRCADSYKADQTAARGHWYDLWYPNQDGTHSAECKRYGCNHEGTTECTLFEVTVKDGDTATILTVCPVCGDHERAPFGVVTGAAIKTVFINHTLPRGEQIVRELDAPFDGVLYAFTAAYESAGRVEPFNGKVSVSLPLDAEKYAGFKLVCVDVTPATETTERTEVWTDVAFTFDNGKLTFETYVAGLFLLVPTE